MKLPKLPLAGTILVTYLLYTAFVPVSMAHSIILLSLAALCGFDFFLKQHQQPRMEKQMSDFQEEILKLLNTQKEEHEVKLLELKNEQSRQSIERANSSSASSKPKLPVKF